jgi:hypothetical protein
MRAWTICTRAALAVLAVEEVGKFNLLKGDKAEAQWAMRYHPPKQRAVASFVVATGIAVKLSCAA